MLDVGMVIVEIVILMQQMLCWKSLGATRTGLTCPGGRPVSDAWHNADRAVVVLLVSRMQASELPMRDEYGM